MSNCPFRRVCAFYRNEMEYMPGTAGLYRRKYCGTRSAGCARHMIYRAAGAQAVPPDLFPYQQARAAEILGNPASHASSS